VRLKILRHCGELWGRPWNDRSRTLLRYSWEIKRLGFEILLCFEITIGNWMPIIAIEVVRNWKLYCEKKIWNFARSRLRSWKL